MFSNLLIFTLCFWTESFPCAFSGLRYFPPMCALISVVLNIQGSLFSYQFLWYRLCPPIQFSSDPNYPVTAHPQVKGKVLYKTFRTSDACLGGHLYFWPTGCRLGGSHDPIRLGNSLEPLTESSTVNGFIIKAIDEDQPNEETHRAKSVGENAELLCPHGIQVCHHLSTSLCHQPGSSSEPQCPEFLSGFQSIGMIDSLATWLNSISSCPLIPRGWMAESSNPLIMCLVFWMTVSQPEGI